MNYLEHLTTAPGKESLDVTVRFSYIREIVPPKCRNPRPVQFDDGNITVSIPRVDKKDAPVAIISHNDILSKVTKTYRWWEEKLYRCHFRGWACGDPRSNLGKIGVDGRVSWNALNSYAGPRLCDTQSAQEISIASYYGQFILIGNQLYKQVQEPKYVIMTFGLGGNHSGTALMDHDYYNSNIVWNRYYRLDQKKEALAEMNKIAKARGDTKSVGNKPHTKFKILIPDAIRANPEVEYGGRGDSFINAANAITEAAGGNQIVAALGLMSKAFE